MQEHDTPSPSDQKTMTRTLKLTEIVIGAMSVLSSERLSDLCEFWKKRMGVLGLILERIMEMYAYRRGLFVGTETGNFYPTVPLPGDILVYDVARHHLHIRRGEVLLSFFDKKSSEFSRFSEFINKLERGQFGDISCLIAHLFGLASDRTWEEPVEDQVLWCANLVQPQ